MWKVCSPTRQNLPTSVSSGPSHQFLTGIPAGTEIEKSSTLWVDCLIGHCWKHFREHFYKKNGLFFMNKTTSVSSRKNDIHVTSWYLQRVLTSAITKLTVVTRIVSNVTSVDFVQATMLSKKKETKDVLGDVYCLKKIWMEKLARYIMVMLLLEGPFLAAWSVRGGSLICKKIFTLQKYVNMIKTKKSRFLSKSSIG